MWWWEQVEWAELEQVELERVELERVEQSWWVLGPLWLVLGRSQLWWILHLHTQLLRRLHFRS